jgi:C_GCAxxG_C_C family probable redox protein
MTARPEAVGWRNAVNDVESAVDVFLKDCACSQAILVTYSRRYGLDPGHAMKLAAGLAGGMRMAETCGAVTGAIMVLGMHGCGDDCNTGKGREKTYSLVREFTARFEQRNGSTRCKELLDCDISTAEGMKAAKDRNLFKTRCADMVRSAAEILEEMLKEG